MTKGRFVILSGAPQVCFFCHPERSGAAGGAQSKDPPGGEASAAQGGVPGLGGERPNRGTRPLLNAFATSEVLRFALFEGSAQDDKGCEPSSTCGVGGIVHWCRNGVGRL